MRKAVKNQITVKTPIKKRFYLRDPTEKETEYLQSLTIMLKEKRRGDWTLIGEMLGISAVSAEMAFFRVYQKNHFEVVEALKKVIAKRKDLINQ